MDPPHRGCEGAPQSCGFHPNHNVSIWRSADLSNASWEYVGNAVECTSAPGCRILYRPHLVYNPTTRLYVLFYNYVSTDGPSRNGVATAPHPAGPFTIVRPVMKTARPSLPSNHEASVGDFDVLVDGDGKAYMVYSYGPMSIEQLTPDFLDSAGINATFVPGPVLNRPSELPEDFCEAPSLWARNGTYWLTTGHCCCFCYQGSGMITYTAPHPLGPWTKQPGAVDLGCVPGTTPTPSERRTLPITAIPSPGQGCAYKNAMSRSVSQAQQNSVVPIATTTGWVYVWTGDRWMQAPDGQKAHEPQFWGRLQFDAHGGALMPLTWTDQLELDVLDPQPPHTHRLGGMAPLL